MELCIWARILQIMSRKTTWELGIFLTEVITIDRLLLKSGRRKLTLCIRDQQEALLGEVVFSMMVHWIVNNQV